MAEIDINKRNFFKVSILGLGLFFLDYTKLGKMAQASADVLPTDEFAVLYSIATGIVLRTINPYAGEQAHLDWLDQNKPAGTALLRIKKVDLGADHNNCPNLDVVIPHAKQRLGVNLAYGVPCSIVDDKNKVVETVLCCPALYQAKIQDDAVKTLSTPKLLVQQAASIGDDYDPIKKKFSTPKKVDIIGLS